jgi:hypothetical protein
MITAGMDFAYQYADINFKFFENVTDLLNHDSNGKKYKLKFSTLDEYMKAIKKD